MAEKDAAPEVELDEDAKKLLLDKIKAEARKAIADAQKPDLPTLPTEIPRGSMEFGDKGSVVAALEALGVLTEVAEDVVTAIWMDLNLHQPEVGDFRVLLVDTLDVAGGYATFRLIDSQLDILSSTAKGALELFPDPEPDRDGDGPHAVNLLMAPILLPLLSLGASALPLVLNTLKTDYTVQSRVVDVSWSAVAAALARQLTHRGLNVAIRTLLPPTDDEGVMKRTKDLAEVRVDLLTRQARCRINELEGEPKIELASARARVETLRKAYDTAKAADRAEISNRIDEVLKVAAKWQSSVDAASYKIAAAQSVIDVIDAFLDRVTTTPASGFAPIITAAVHEQLLDDENSYVLFAQSVAVGGESIYERKVGTDKAHHLGGVSVAWVLTDATSTVCSSGVQTRIGQISSNLGSKPDVAASQRIGLAFEDTDPTPPGLQSG